MLNGRECGAMVRWYDGAMATGVGRRASGIEANGMEPAFATTFTSFRWSKKASADKAWGMEHGAGGMGQVAGSKSSRADDARHKTLGRAGGRELYVNKNLVLIPFIFIFINSILAEYEKLLKNLLYSVLSFRLTDY